MTLTHPTPVYNLPDQRVSLYQDEPIPDHPGPGLLADLTETPNCETVRPDPPHPGDTHYQTVF